MIYKILILFFVLNNYSCQGQSNENIKFAFPFEKSDIQYHQKNILTGASYLLLVPYDVGAEDKGRIINIAWYESKGEEKGMRFIDSLLNIGIVEETYGNSKFEAPILKSTLEYYKDISTCEVINLLFTKEGYFRGWNYYTDIRALLAVLLDREVEIYEVDYNGELVIVPNKYNCY